MPNFVLLSQSAQFFYYATPLYINLVVTKYQVMAHYFILDIARSAGIVYNWKINT